MKDAAHQIPLDLSMRPTLGRDDFHIGPSNQDAITWIDRWPDWPAPLLIISGPAASGKSHIAAVWQEKSEAVSINPETLLTQTAEEIAGQGASLVLDGLDLWIGDREAETTLFHLYNIFKEEQRSFLVTSRMNPAQSDFVIADLASRFRAAPVATIKPPDDMLLGSVLIKLFSDRQLSIGNEVLSYILPRMERSFVAAKDIVANADKLAYSQKRKISIPLMRRVLSEMMLDEEY
ncbi:MAG: DnaA/Hda family protein [Pseudomonadota bacterium]